MRTVVHPGARFGPAATAYPWRAGVRAPASPSNAAFTLVEVLVAVAIIGIMFFALYAGITSGFVVMRLARENLRATQILQEKTETIRLYNWDQINSNGFIPPTFTTPFTPAGSNTPASALVYTGSVAFTTLAMTEAYSNDLRLVTVQVQWLSGNKVRTRSMATLVSRYGLQNYVY